MSDSSPRRAQIIFTLSLITIVVSVIFILLAIKLDFNNLIYLNVINIFFYLLCAFFAKIGNLNDARVLYLITINASIFTSASYIGQDGGIEFMFIYTLSLPFMVYSFTKEKIFIFSFCLAPIILWICLFSYDFNLFKHTKVDSEIASNLIYPISIITTLCLATFQLFYYALINFTDFSSIHNNRESALEASEAKSKFLSTMSHEIRTPLNAVIGLSHILGNNNPRKDQVQNIEALNYSGKILLNLLNNVLDFSKMQSTTIELDNIPTDIQAATKQIKKIHETACLKKGIDMTLDVDNDIPLVWLDIVRFNQVINNLVTNAIKFTDKGGVTLRIKKQEHTKDHLNLLTEVIDTGIGIPKDKQETIWEAFTQASSTINRLYGGTGLGLPIVKSIVEAMGSDVKIDSLKGNGSRFYFNINLKIASEKELQKNTEKKLHNFQGKKVLLVEDNLINVMVAKQILEKVDLKVDVANDGLEAVNMVKEKLYDVILMDIQMPIMDGYTASKEIRKFNKHIPILALSASVFMEVKDQINQSGMNGFIFKPFDPEDLFHQIEKVVNI